MVHFGPFWPEEVHFGPFRSANRTLAIPDDLFGPLSETLSESSKSRGFSNVPWRKRASSMEAF